MKRLTFTLALAVCQWSRIATAQEAAPAAPATPPVPPAATAPAETAKPDDLGPFKDKRERQSYGLGQFLGTREQGNAQRNPEGTPVNTDEILAGLKAGLSDEHGTDYAVGMSIAAQVRRSGVDVDNAVLEEAMRAVLTSQTTKLTPLEVQSIMQEIQNGIQERQQAKQKAEAEQNLAASTAFLETNGKAEGVKTTESGLQFKIEKEGEGTAPAERDLVTLNLRGSVPGGQDFEKSPEGAPFKRPLPMLPKGLQEGLRMLKPGGKATFWLPPALGFGEAPRGSQVKGNSVLIYEVELVSAEAPPPPTAAPAGPNGAPRRPITAVTPPVAVDIPPASKDGKPVRVTPPVQVSPPVQVPPPAPAPAPAPAPDK